MAHISITDALAAVHGDVKALSAERIPLAEAAGRVLAEDVLADRDQPPFNRSAMDGFAVRSADADQAPCTLRIVGEVQAGAMSDHTLVAGEAIRIMTGAPVPAGADAVQMVEKTSCTGETVTITEAVRAGQHIAEQGQDVRAGAVAVPAGAVLTSGRLGVCWSFGAAEPAVVRRPRVAVLTTGDELVELHEMPGPTQIRDSNRCTIGQVITRAGGVVVRSEIVRDDIDATRQAIAQALTADVLVLSGGVSAGEYDYVAQCLIAEGVEQVFHKVAMKPGKPVWYGRKGAVHVIGLPGNPVSSLVTARLFLAPLLRGLGGRTTIYDPVVPLPLLAGFGGTRGRPTYQPARVIWGEGVQLLKTHGSGDLKGQSVANALALLPPNRAGFEEGETLNVLIDEETLRT